MPQPPWPFIKHTSMPMLSRQHISKVSAAVVCALPAEWEAYLQQYMAAHPEVTVIDRVDRIKALHNRATMLCPHRAMGSHS